MKKNIQRINESQLRYIVSESVKKVLNEKSIYMSHEDVLDAWYRAEKILGTSDFLSDIYGYLGDDKAKDLLISINRDYELGLFDE